MPLLLLTGGWSGERTCAPGALAGMLAAKVPPEPQGAVRKEDVKETPGTRRKRKLSLVRKADPGNACIRGNDGSLPGAGGSDWIGGGGAGSRGSRRSARQQVRAHGRTRRVL